MRENRVVARVVTNLPPRSRASDEDRNQQSQHVPGASKFARECHPNLLANHFGRRDQPLPGLTVPAHHTISSVKSARCNVSIGRRAGTTLRRLKLRSQHRLRKSFRTDMRKNARSTPYSRAAMVPRIAGDESASSGGAVVCGERDNGAQNDAGDSV